MHGVEGYFKAIALLDQEPPAVVMASGPPFHSFVAAITPRAATALPWFWNSGMSGHKRHSISSNLVMQINAGRSVAYATRIWLTSAPLTHNASI